MVHGTSAQKGGVSDRRHFTETRFETLHLDMHGNYPPGMHNQATHFMVFTTDTHFNRVSFFTTTKAVDYY
jgi:hypothetical protein